MGKDMGEHGRTTEKGCCNSVTTSKHWINSKLDIPAGNWQAGDEYGKHKKYSK